VPAFVRFSLPDGLYCASYVLLMDAVWQESGKVKYFAVAFIPLVAMIHELCQFVGLARGTFDAADLFCYALPLFLYFIILKLTTNLNTRKHEKVFISNAIVSIVYHRLYSIRG